ncbi:MAG: Tfp pilus assembly protein FimT/FimU [Aquificaceae bacterium]
MDRKIRGITIIEVIVVMAILSILASTAIIQLIKQIQRQRLIETTQKVVQTLEEVRRMSSSRQNMYGVRISGNLVEIYEYNSTQTNCGPGTIKESYTLPSGVILDVDSQVVILYDRMGYPRNYSCGFGANRIILKSQPLNSHRAICINRYGRIRVVEGQTCPQE